MSFKFSNHSLTEIMSSGGDNRITLSERTGLNKYGCKPYPDHLMNYGSTTSNNISYDTYSNLITVYNSYVNSNSEIDISEKYIQEFKNLRHQITKLFNLDKNTRMIFGPSGTDLELIILGLGLSSKEGKVLNVLISPDEGGSGVFYSASGNHFSNITSLGHNVKINTKLNGFNQNNVQTRFFYTRDKSGSEISNSKLFIELLKIIEDGCKKNQRVIVHCMHVSKLGNIFPTYDQINLLIDKFGDKIDIVLDSCQGRISPNLINKYLNIGVNVLTTGSKFFAGPPFSGVLFVNYKIIERVISNFNLNHDLSKYLTLHEWPDEFHEKLNYKHTYNFGLLFRWKAAVFELKKFHQVDLEKAKTIIESFRKEVSVFLENSNIFESYDNSEKSINNFNYHPFDFKTLFVLNIKQDMFAESIKFSNYLHKSLGKDLSKDPEFKNYNHLSFLQTKINVGQPVILNLPNFNVGNIRISINLQTIHEFSILEDAEINFRFRSELDYLEKKSSVISDVFTKKTNKSIL